MSKISLAPAVAGTGIFTIASPGTSTNRTLTLPDDTGTIVTNSGNQAGSFTTLNTSGQVVFNDAGADVDFRVEGDTDANLLFVDASTDRVGIGTNAPTTKLQVDGPADIGGETNNVGIFGSSSTNAGIIGTTANQQLNIFGNGTGPIVFQTGAAFLNGLDVLGTERARITSAGYFKASNNGSYLNSTGSFYEFNSDDADDSTLLCRATNASLTSPSVFEISTSRNTTNNTYFAMSYYGATAYRFRIADSGNVTNTNDLYGPISSDQRLKQDIVDASSQWDDLKNIRIRKFHYRNDPDGHLQIGCIAQEAEQVSPGLVDRRPVTKEDVLVNPELGTLVDDLEKPITDGEGNITGYEKKVETDTEVLSFKSSILFWKATKALQEAIERIETLEAKVAALEAK